MWKLNYLTDLPDLTAISRKCNDLNENQITLTLIQMVVHFVLLYFVFNLKAKENQDDKINLRAVACGPHPLTN